MYVQTLLYSTIVQAFCTAFQSTFFVQTLRTYTVIAGMYNRIVQTDFKTAITNAIVQPTLYMHYQRLLLYKTAIIRRVQAVHTNACYNELHTCSPYS